MIYRYTLTRPEELAAGGEMEPAVVLRISLAAIANAIADRIETKGFNPIVSDRDSDAMYVRVDDVPLVFVSFNEEPSEVHVYAEDRKVEGRSSLLRLLALLPLSGVEGDWWTRDDQPRWPGNGADTFVIGQ
ncbi:hypothetical protein [Paraburkholderia bryophila]|uniref:Uncharacterized protein n=1 Tax=Paraburkholderia bryophila TaxID=420952 RepID=A0A7Y9WS01_9BURK|nr:hypothetical protein [Paraburkholderia bryophila]NYH25992.1 hypothetical protein [Paraburkholderia bryophila]